MFTETAIVEEAVGCAREREQRGEGRSVELATSHAVASEGRGGRGGPYGKREGAALALDAEVVVGF